MVRLGKQIFCFLFCFWVFLKAVAFYLPEKRFKAVKITSKEEPVDREKLLPLKRRFAQRNPVSSEAPLFLPKIEDVEEELDVSTETGETHSSSQANPLSSSQNNVVRPKSHADNFDAQVDDILKKVLDMHLNTPEETTNVEFLFPNLNSEEGVGGRYE